MCPKHVLCPRCASCRGCEEERLIRGDLDSGAQQHQVAAGDLSPTSMKRAQDTRSTYTHEEPPALRFYLSSRKDIASVFTNERREDAFKAQRRATELVDKRPRQKPKDNFVIFFILIREVADALDDSEMGQEKCTWRYGYSRAVSKTGRQHDLGADPRSVGFRHLEPEHSVWIDHDIVGDVRVVVRARTL